MIMTYIRKKYRSKYRLPKFRILEYGFRSGKQFRKSYVSKKYVSRLWQRIIFDWNDQRKSWLGDARFVEIRVPFGLNRHAHDLFKSRLFWRWLIGWADFWRLGGYFGPNDAVFSTDPLLYHKFENIVIFRPGCLYSLCSPGNQDYQKIIHFLFFIKKGRNRQCKSCILLELVVFINESCYNKTYIFLIIEVWIKLFDGRFLSFSWKS